VLALCTFLGACATGTPPGSLASSSSDVSPGLSQASGNSLSNEQVYGRLNNSPQVLVGRTARHDGMFYVVVASQPGLADVMLRYLLDDDDAAAAEGFDRLTASGIDLDLEMVCIGTFSEELTESGSQQGVFRCEPGPQDMVGVMKRYDGQPDYVLGKSVYHDDSIAVMIGGTKTEFGSFAARILHDRLNAGRLTWPLETY
jgi:hypothetical protein